MQAAEDSMRLRRSPVTWTRTAADDELVGWAQRGEHEAFGVLYDRHFGSVYGYCYRHLGEREAAQDAAAETFRKAWASLPSYRPHAFRAWLFGIARHVVADTVRVHHADLTLEEVTDLPATGLSVEEMVLARAETDSLVALLSQLTADQRDAIALRLAGMSPVEIGTALGKSRAAVDMTLHRALLRLRDLTVVGAETGGSGRD
jgi:RNA polymerase sigma-70 factor (ECF subfamily)